LSDKELDTKDELPEEQVWDMLKFADAYSGNQIYPGILTPMLINQRLKELTMNPLQATEDSLNAALKDPKNSELQLQSFSQDFENQSQPYKRLLSYLGSMLSFDLTYECVNAKFTDYTSPAYQKDLDVVKSFIDRFDYKKEFPVTVREMLRNEAFFCSTRFDEENITLQELNASPTYTMITGRSAYTPVFSFNMYFFMLPGIDLEMFDPFFGQKFSKLWGKDGVQLYDPALSIDARGNSSWVYWQDIPVGKPPFGWCFKMHPEIATRLPYFTPLFNDLIQQPLMRALQKSINMSVAARIISGEIPMLKDTAAKVKDQFALTPQNAGQFLAIVKAAIGDAVKAISLPLNGVKGIEFKSENDVYPTHMKNMVAMSGVNANLIFTNENRTNSIESQLSVGVDEQLMERIYPQANNFLNFYINRGTSKFKFKFNFEGTNNYTNRNQRFEKVMKLADKGIILPQKIAAAIGIDPFDFQRQLDEARATGFVENLTPILSSFQMSGKDGGNGGRPEKSDSDLSDSGDQTRSDGGNDEKKNSD
jgi:hypothetical protein